ncbi:MAG: N-acetylmuramoyl-L-alanine amidase [Acidiferrobacteraceae bacterium]|nr:N-acetylmuramoyl-L-alanine amidase [Acidiferrobacteraceae bacterium]MDP6434604.1 N-acetylmuramoyl-L-alanine amidase [Arenicellales bacterium]MDP6672759.1 N-acetylmuramoyl-L-alanine amidase [Arenicellales bacterium]MDP6724227.1 N-acetylmuramoyl-L-alanine amidase [Arenicellales bacterium]
MNSRISFIVLLVVLLGWGDIASADSVSLTNLRFWHAPTRTRLVFDLDGPVRYKVFRLENPSRLVVDFDRARFNGELPSNQKAGPFISKVRKGVPSPEKLRIVLDLDLPLKASVFSLLPNDVYGYRLVIDLNRIATPVARADPSGKSSQTTEGDAGDFVVVIDAGHGGEDPGAIGSRRTREKNVVLAIAKELKQQLDALPGVRGVLTRKSDYYISLRRRTTLARKYKADIFISIHADAFPKKQVRGSSVFALSRRGASSETARWLAKKENSADLAGGVSIADKDDQLAEVLLDMSITKTINDSIVLASNVLKELARIGKVHSRYVEQAGFVVLKSPDIPSILVETAFITNPTEEKLLNSKSHQKQIAGAIRKGVQRYMRLHASNRSG